MESDDREWIQGGTTQPEDEESLSGDDGWPAPVAGAVAGKRWGHGGIPGFSGWVAAAVAVVAAAAGVAVGLFLVRGTPASAVSAAGRATPSASAAAPGASAAAPSASAVAPGASAGTLRVVLTGQVRAVSRTSITIGGAGPAVTAAVTSATTITGRVRGIDGVKPGDEVSAQLTGTAGKLVATAIQDPGST
jgi:hypothetical protein